MSQSCRATTVADTYKKQSLSFHCLFCLFNLTHRENIWSLGLEVTPREGLWDGCSRLSKATAHFGFREFYKSMLLQQLLESFEFARPCWLPQADYPSLLQCTPQILNFDSHPLIQNGGPHIPWHALCLPFIKLNYNIVYTNVSHHGKHVVTLLGSSMSGCRISEGFVVMMLRHHSDHLLK